MFGKMAEGLTRVTITLSRANHRSTQSLEHMVAWILVVEINFFAIGIVLIRLTLYVK
jgi:hypothetical protein